MRRCQVLYIAEAMHVAIASTGDASCYLESLSVAGRESQRAWWAGGGMSGWVGVWVSGLADWAAECVGASGWLDGW